MQELNLKAALTLLRRSGATLAFQPGSVEYLQEVVDGLVALSAVDPLTGLPNRRRLDEELVRHEKLTRRGRRVSLLAVDIDDFKSVNDCHGHSVGDKVLKTAARSLQAAVRDSDILMRIGGEEFAVILPDADIDTARNTAERVLPNVLRGRHRPADCLDRRRNHAAGRESRGMPRARRHLPVRCQAKRARPHRGRLRRVGH